MRIEDILLLGCLIFSIGTMYLDFSNLKYENKRIILFVMMLFAIFVGYEYFPLSPDFYGYKFTYYDYASGNFEFESIQDGILDYGFLWLCELVKSLGGDFFVFYLVVCAISLCCCYSSLMKYTTFTFSAWFLLFARTFYENNINQIRQGLAICIFIFALRYVVERKILKFIALIIVAALVHKTMIVAACILPLSYIRWDVKKISVFILATIFLYSIDVYNYLLVFMMDYFNIGVAKLSAYSTDSVHMAAESSSYLIYRSLLLVLLALYLLKWGKIKYNNLHISMLLMAFSSMLIFSELSIFSSRFSAIFSSSFCFALPEIYRESKSLTTRLIFMGIIIFIGITFFLKNHFLSTI